MHNFYQKELLAGGIVITLLFYASSARTDTNNPHLVAKNQIQGSNCTSCHIIEPRINADGLLSTKNQTVELPAFKIDGVAMCTGCHPPNQGHITGLTIDFPVPADMPLNENNQIICRTCHYMHGNLSSEIPQASFSFMDRLLNAKRLHKSFILRRNNANGELCLICHNPAQELK